MSDLHIADFPEELLRQVERQAALHDCTVRDEIIRRVRGSMGNGHKDPEATLSRIRALRESLPFETTMEDILAAIDRDRP